MTSELDLLRMGVRFRREPSRTYGSAVQAQGPRDEAIVASLREAVCERQAMLGDLRAARAGVSAKYPGGLPPGICETCGDTLVRVHQTADGASVVKPFGGSGMCHLCSMARLRALTTRADESAKEAA